MRARLALTVLMLSLVGPFSASASHTLNCNDRGAPFAKFLQPQGGQVSVTTQAGTTTVTAAPAAPVGSLSLSTTGTIDVKIEYACLSKLTLDVYKDGNPAPVYSSANVKECEHATQTDIVPIGLDGGKYTFSLGGVTCSGAPIKRDDHGGFVGDPPLPL